MRLSIAARARLWRRPALRTSLTSTESTWSKRAVWDSECLLSFFPVISSIEWGRPGRKHGASSCFKARSDYLAQYNQKETTVATIRLDTYCTEQHITAIDLLCIDAQGVELRILHGLGELIKSVHYIITEIEVRPIYHGQALYPEIHAYLKSNGFCRTAEVYRHPPTHN